jgi:hypothetical protein
MLLQPHLVRGKSKIELSSIPLPHIPDENAANTKAQWPTGLHAFTHMHSVGRVDIDYHVVFVQLRPN